MGSGGNDEVKLGIYEGASLLKVCSPSFAALFRLWDEKRAGRAMPARSDFDPVELKPWLGRVNLLDVIVGPPMDFRYRLCGTRTVEEYGVDLTGKRFSEAVYVGTPEAALVAMAEFVRIGKPRYRNDPIRDPQGYAMMRERIYLPLAGDGRTVDMVLGYQESKILVHPASRVR